MRDQGLCLDCADNQTDRKAVKRIGPHKRPCCLEHYRNRLGIFEKPESGVGLVTIPLEKQQEIARDSETLSIREIVDKHDVSVNTAQKYMRKRGPRTRIRAHFVDGDNGKWVTMENLIVTLEAERKMLLAKIHKIDKAISVLRGLE